MHGALIVILNSNCIPYPVGAGGGGRRGGGWEETPKVKGPLILFVSFRGVNVNSFSH